MAKKEKKPASKSRAPGETPSDDVSDLVLSLHLLRLVESKAELHIHGKRFPNAIQVKAEVNAAEPRDEGDKYRLFSRVSADLQGTAEDHAETKLEILVRWEVQFHSSRKPTQEEMQFVVNSAAHMAWPYIREFVSSVTARMGSSTILLPMLRIDPKEGLVLIQFDPPG